MSYFDKYKQRVGLDGSTIAESFKQSSIEFANHSFADSPSFAQIDIDGTVTDVRIINGNKSNEMELLFRPESVHYAGQQAIIDGERWMIVDYFKHKMTPKAKIEKLTQSLRWIDSSGNTCEIYCIASEHYIKGLSEGTYITLPDGRARVIIRYNEMSKKIGIEHRFVLGSAVYEVVSIDDYSKVENDVGIIILMMDRTEKRDSDDFVGKIADNSHINSIPSSGGGGWL